VLKFVCRVAIEPDTCVSKTHSVYLRYGPQSLLISKFLPWFGTLGPPLAGMFNLAIWRFLLIDATGALLWAGAYVGPAGCSTGNWKMSWPHYRDWAPPSDTLWWRAFWRI
jgi:membrane protein DedA with SNARE-associated domain